MFPPKENPPNVEVPAGAAVVAGSGVFPSKPPPKIFAPAVPPEGADALSPGLGMEPKSPPVGAGVDAGCRK